MRERAIEKVAALFPIPLLLRARRGSSGDGWTSQLPMLSDHAAAGSAKLAAVAAIVVAGLGAGVSTQVGKRDAADRPARTAGRTLEARTVKSSTAPVSGTVAASRAASDSSVAGTRSRSGRATVGSGSIGSVGRQETTVHQGKAAPAGGSGSGSGRAVPNAVTDNAPAAPGGSAPSTPSTPSTPSAPNAEAPRLPSVQVPAVTLPQNSGEAPAPPVVVVPEATVDVQGTLDDTLSGAQQTVGDVGDAANGLLGGG